MTVDLTNVPSEDDEQAKVVQYLDWQRIDFYAIPNGGKRSVQEAAKFKRTGVRPGIPDLAIPIPRSSYHGLYIELKRRKGGGLSDNQKYWIDRLNALGYKAVMCRGADQAIDIIEEYMKSG